MKDSHGEEIKYSSRIEKYHSKAKTTKHKKISRKIEKDTAVKIEDVVVLEEEIAAPENIKEETISIPQQKQEDSFYVSKAELMRGVFDDDFLKAEEEAKKKAEEEAKKAAEEQAEAEKAIKAEEQAEASFEDEADTIQEDVTISQDEDKIFADELAKFEADLESLRQSEEIVVDAEEIEENVDDSYEEDTEEFAEESQEDFESTAVVSIPKDLIETEEETFEEELIIEKPKKKISKNAKAWIISIVCVAAAICAMMLFVFEIVTVDGFSMQPTLNGGEKVIVEKVSRYAAFPERGQIIATKYDGYDGYYLKRVIAYPGEWVEIYDNTVYINGEALSENYISKDIAYDNMELVQVPEDHVYVLGDNRAMSLDSRQDTIGCIHESNILGNAWCVIWPFENIRLVD